MTVEKPKPKQLLRPITTGADSATNQSQFLEITCNTLKAREKSHVHGAIAFGFAYHWLKNWRESFKPITKRSNRNYIITFDSHLKTALYIHGLFIASFDFDKQCFREEMHGFLPVRLQFSRSFFETSISFNVLHILFLEPLHSAHDRHP